MSSQFWLEAAKLAASMATPLIVAILGILLLRRIEGIKTEVAKQSDFHKEWAKQFFACCQDFLNSMERELALLTSLSNLEPENRNDDFGMQLQREMSVLHLKLSELGFRIQRCVVFAPGNGPSVTQAANACVCHTASLLRAKQGNTGKIIEEMNKFNIAAREAHAEMLGLGATEQTAVTTTGTQLPE